MKIKRDKYFVEVTEMEGDKLKGRMMLANDASAVSFQRSPMNYSCKARPTKPVEQMTDDEIKAFYAVAAKEHDEEAQKFKTFLEGGIDG